MHNLVHGGRLPVFEAQRSGRISRAYLEQQPDDAVPRFQYEDHIAALLDARRWPESTRAISELRLTLEYQSASGWGRLFSAGRLSIDIVDYPGEWLLDLPLLASPTPNSRAKRSNLPPCPSARIWRLPGDPWRPRPIPTARPTKWSRGALLNSSRSI